MILIGPYIYKWFFKSLLSYEFIDLYFILNQPNSVPIKLINLSSLLVYQILIYRDFYCIVIYYPKIDA